MLPDEKSHGLSIQRKILQHNIEIPTILDKEARHPSFRKRFSPKVLSTSIVARLISVFVLPLSENPRTAYNNTYGLKANHNGPQLTPFYGLRTSYALHIYSLHYLV